MANLLISKTYIMTRKTYVAEISERPVLKINPLRFKQPKDNKLDIRIMQDIIKSKNNGSLPKLKTIFKGSF